MDVCARVYERGALGKVADVDTQAGSLPRSLVVIGGGTAGRAAAIEAARCGLAVILLDEAAGCEPPPGDLADHLRACPGTSALALSADREILWTCGETSGTFRAEGVILATGGRPRAVPFPGWTLPGVVAAKDLDAAEVRPGTRVLVGGSGSGMGSLASRLREAGADVVAVLDAGEAISPVGDESAEGHIPILRNHAVFAAMGRDRVEGASIGPVDPETWRPRRDRARTVAADLIATDFGTEARDELAVLAGCRMAFDRERGGWGPARDERMRTSVAGIFAAGPGADPIRSADEGRIAAISVAEDFGVLSKAEADDRREEPLRRLRAFARKGAAAPRPGLLDLMEPDTVLCRCEAVPLSAVREAIGHGFRDLPSIKLATRLGMGVCQGRECGGPASAVACRETGRSFEEVGRINPRPPARPVTLGALARMSRDALPPVANGGGR